MGSGSTVAAEPIPSLRSIKVHHQLCSELIRFVTRASKILPRIEASRPRCTSGLQALCVMNNAISKAKSILQSCSESSKLYLALTGDVILSRCEKSMKSLEQSLSEMQFMVPVLLAAEISRLIADLRAAKFRLYPCEEEARKVMKELLRQYGSPSDPSRESALEAIKVAMSKLNITTPKALLIEKRYIRIQLGKVGEGEQPKKKILLFFLNLLNKYGKKILEDTPENGSLERDDSFDPPSADVEAEIGILNRPSPPNEFICPISSRLMYDPVVVASGETYERMWIQRWFDEGKDVCPKTKKRLDHFSLVPNNSMKDLISKWSAENGLASSDPVLQAAMPQPWEISSGSIASLGSSMNDLSLPIDFSNLSLGSGNYFPGNSREFKSGESVNETGIESLYSLELLSWESQCSTVEQVRGILQLSDQGSSQQASLENCVQPLMRFLNDANERQDENAQISGCQLLLTFLEKYSSSAARCLDESAYDLLVSFLTTEVSTKALAILEKLSSNGNCQINIARSGALNLVLDMLNSEDRDLLEPSIRTVCNISGNDQLRSLLAPSELIPRLVPFFNDPSLTRYSLTILNNLCSSQDARICVAETDGCISSLVNLLESEIFENQEHAVALLLSLCSQRSQYCNLVMAEGVIPHLCTICVNGNPKGKAMASELLRILQDEYRDVQESPPPYTEAIADTVDDSAERKKSSKATRILGKILRGSSSSSAKKKR